MFPPPLHPYETVFAPPNEQRIEYTAPCPACGALAEWLGKRRKVLDINADITSVRVVRCPVCD